MRILMISYWFPPFNNIGAVRVGKMAKYLARFGHDVRVVAAQDRTLRRTLPVEIPGGNVTHTGSLDVTAPARLARVALGRREEFVARAGMDETPAALKVARALQSLYSAIAYFPDHAVGWLPFAMAASSRVAKQFKPDVIFASAPVYTSLLVAHLLSRLHRTPWVADLRDLWVVGQHRYAYPRWRKAVDQKLERRILSSAVGLVTVSAPLADILRAAYGRPTAVVLNGFDPEDYPPVAATPRRGRGIRIVYTGTLVSSARQDPSPLLDALRLLGAEARAVGLAFYGPSGNIVQQAAARYGLADLVEVNGPVRYRESVSAQTEADILLLLIWDDPGERGVYTGKLFEYIGAGRPILLIGGADNVAADLVRDRRAGVVLESPDEIAEQLRRWIRQKDELGTIPSPPREAALGLSREEQARVLEAFFKDVLPG